MYFNEHLARCWQEERIKRAELERAARRLAMLARLEKSRERAERDLLRAWQRVDQIRTTLGSAS